MKHLAEPVTRRDGEPSGFAVMDDRGRIALPKAARQALRLRPGSEVAYIVVHGAVVLIPEDEHLSALADKAARLVEKAGLTVDDLLTELPVVREGILREDYGDAFVDKIACQHQALQADAGRGRL